MAEGIKYAQPDDPRRCKGTVKQGQCPNLAVPEGTMCRAHGGNKQQLHAANRNIKGLRSSIWQDRIKDFAEEDKIKSLTNEIGILRLLLEERLNTCTDQGDLLLQSAPLSDLVSRVERLVTSCHKLDLQMGGLVNKQALVRFADAIITLVSEHVPPENMEQVASLVVQALEDTSKGEDHAI